MNSGTLNHNIWGRVTESSYGQIQIQKILFASAYFRKKLAENSSLEGPK